MFANDIKTTVEQYGKYLVTSVSDLGDSVSITVRNDDYADKGTNSIHLKIDSNRKVVEFIPNPRKNTIKDFNACVQMGKYVEKLIKRI